MAILILSESQVPHIDSACIELDKLHTAPFEKSKSKVSTENED